MHPLNRISGTWLNFWFAPSSPTNLGVCRVLFFGGMFLCYALDDFSAWSAVDQSFWMPIPPFRRLWALPAETLAIMQLLWKGALLFSCLGLFTRSSTVMAFVLGTYLLGLPHNFGKTHHVDAILVITMGLLALARTGDAVSLDRFLRRDASPLEAPPLCTLPSARLSGEYTWPIRGVCAAFALVFFAAGYSKLMHGGLEWAFSDNFSIALLQSSYHQAAYDPPVRWNLWLAQQRWLCQLMAAGTMAVELAAPLALFSRRARWILVPAFICMQVMIRVLMGPSFFEFMLCNVFWVNWQLLGRRWAGAIPLETLPFSRFRSTVCVP